MSIIFCATAAALDQAQARLAPSTAVTTLISDLEPSALQGVPTGATVLLEAPLAPLPSYQTAAARAVSQLAKRGVQVIVAPSCLETGLLALAGPEGDGAPRTLYVGAAAASEAVAPLLAQEQVCVLLLEADVVAGYEPQTGFITVAGRGCVVMLAKEMAAGSAPAAIVLNVLVPGMRLCW